MTGAEVEFLTTFGSGQFPDLYRSLKDKNRAYIHALEDYVDRFEEDAAEVHLWEAVMNALWAADEEDSELFDRLIDRLEGLSSTDESGTVTVEDFEALEALIHPGTLSHWSGLVEFGSRLKRRRRGVERAEEELLEEIHEQLVDEPGAKDDALLTNEFDRADFANGLSDWHYHNRVAIVTETMLRLADSEEGLTFLSDQFIYGYSAMDNTPVVVGVDDVTYEPVFDPFALLQPTAGDLEVDPDDFDPTASGRGYLATPGVDRDLREALAKLVAILAPAAVQASARLEGNPLGHQLLITFQLQACRLLFGDDEAIFEGDETPSLSYDPIAASGGDPTAVTDLSAVAPGLGQTLQKLGTQSDSILDWLGDAMEAADPPEGSYRYHSIHVFNPGGYILSVIFGIHSLLTSDESLFDGGFNSVEEFMSLSQFALTAAYFEDLDDAGRHLADQLSDDPPTGNPTATEVTNSKGLRRRFLAWVKKWTVRVAPVFALWDVVSNVRAASQALDEGMYRKAAGHGIIAGVSTTLLVTGIAVATAKIVSGSGILAGLAAGAAAMSGGLLLAAAAIVATGIGLVLILHEDTTPLELLIGRTNYGTDTSNEPDWSGDDAAEIDRYLVNRLVLEGDNLGDGAYMNLIGKQAVSVRAAVNPMDVSISYEPADDGFPTLRIETETLPIGSTVRLYPLLPDDDGDADFKYGTGDRLPVSGIRGDTTMIARHELRVTELDSQASGADSREIEHEGAVVPEVDLAYDDGTWTIELTGPGTELLGMDWDDLSGLILSDDLYIEVVMFPPGVRSTLVNSIEQAADVVDNPEAIVVQNSPLVRREYVEVTEADG